MRRVAFGASAASTNGRFVRILVTFALKAEFSPWSSRHPFVPYEFENWEQRREFDLFKANIGVDEVTVLLTGIGRENAARAMASIPLELHDVCISSGLAGALDVGLKPGDVVTTRRVETIERDIHGESEPALVDLAGSCGAKFADLCLTSGKIVATVDEKEELGRKGRVVEMESAHVFSAARQRAVPAVLVRAISDAADEELPVDFGRILDSHGRLKVGGLLKEVGLSPYKIPLLVQFGRQSRHAAKSLAGFLDRYIPAISKDWARLAALRPEEVSAT